MDIGGHSDTGSESVELLLLVTFLLPSSLLALTAVASTICKRVGMDMSGSGAAAILSVW